MGLTARLAPLLLLLAACGDGGERWSVVLISLDTCRADRIGAYGAERPTPTLDALAAESVRFADCLAQSGSTAPSHMSLLTGHYVHRHGLRRNGLVSHPPYTLASLLRAEGWRTAAFTGHGSFQEIYGHGIGFEVFESGGAEVEWPFTRDVAEVVPEALAWLDEVEGEPFFLVVHGYDPHSPYWPPEPWRSELAGWYDGPLDASRRLGFQEEIRAGTFGPRERRYVSDLYDGEVASADLALDVLLAGLRERGLLERSIVVFTSDHGEDLGERDHVGHVELNEPVLRVPLTMRFPGRRWDGVVEHGVQHVDLVPTLLSALGVEAPPGLHGIDLMELVRGERTTPEGERLRLAQREDTYAVRFDARWKAVFELDGTETAGRRLHDLERDPEEALNLIRHPAGRERFDDIVARYLAWRERTADDDERFGARLPAPVGTVYDEELRRLRALGYVDGEEDEGSGD